MEKRFLILRWIGSDVPSIPIYDEASVSSARQRVRDSGLTFNANKTFVETVALMASELTHNQLAYARQGYFGVRPIERDGIRGLEILAADLGPGFEKRVLTGSSPTEGSLGAGLESIFKLADEIEIDTRLAEGLRVLARKFETQTSSSVEVAVAGAPYPGEGISGDDALYLQSESGFLAAVCDGLGHGPEAREASNKAIDAVARNRDLGLREILDAVNEEMAGVRGCVLAVVRFTAQSRVLQCLSAGDIRVHLYQVRDAHFFTPTPFVVGDRDVRSRRLRVEEIIAAPGSVLVMFTDGLESKTSIKGQLDLLRKPALVIAQDLLAEHSRGTDDALVLVARFKK
jgi:serine/threonine protein phosphatase PrpC/anti-sigma regulatory factor (Ser/Thr protein kinase)